MKAVRHSYWHREHGLVSDSAAMVDGVVGERTPLSAGKRPVPLRIEKNSPISQLSNQAVRSIVKRCCAALGDPNPTDLDELSGVPLRRLARQFLDRLP